MTMKTIAAAKFKAQCLSLLDDVDKEGIVITKRGKPVARLLPYDESPASMIGCLKGALAIHGDIMTTGTKWNAES